MSEVISRLNIYGNAGADVAMVADKCTADEINQLVYEVDLPIVLCSGVPEVTIDLTIKEFDDLGVDIVLYTASSVFLAAHAVRRAYDSLNSTERKSDKIASTEQLNDLLGVPNWRDLETRTIPER
jgi:2-methylisocitrate lyase-like PEP mutase family enzyme